MMDRQHALMCLLHTHAQQEHYPAIVLAVEGLGNETNCDSQGHTFVDWTKMTKDGRPRSFRRREITDELIADARLVGNSAEAVEV